METKDFTTIMNDLKNYMISHNTNITDFNEGSNIMTIFEAIANVIEEAYIDTRIGYSNSIKQIATSIFNFQKKQGSKASANVTFSRSKERNYSVVIPIGTVISDGIHNFITTNLAVIEENEIYSNEVGAIAEKNGNDYNVTPNTITSIVSSVDSDIVSVTNAFRAVGGADEETETEMLARFKTYINGLQGTNYYGLKAGLLKHDCVRSVGIIENFSSDNPKNIIIYIDDGTGSLTEELRNELMDLINGDGTIEKQGLRAAGINVDIMPASSVNINIRGTCRIYRYENERAKSEIENVLVNYVNQLLIGDNVVLTDIILRIRQLSYVKDITGLEIATGEEFSADNITINQNQIARIGQINITCQSVGEQ